MKKMIAWFAVVVLLVTAAPTALAVENAAVEAGRTAALVFRFSDVLSMDGSFLIDDPDGIVKSHTISVSDTAGVSVSVEGDRVWAVPSGEPSRTTVVVTVRVALNDNAAAGKRCTVTFSGVYSSDETAPETVEQTVQSAAVTVQAKKVIVTDYSALRRQLDAAAQLHENDYTADSWEVLAAAVANGIAAEKSKEQKTVDLAAQSIEKAAAGLVAVDRSALYAAVEAAKACGDADAVIGECLALADAVRVGSTLFESRDQAAVDAATAQINEALSMVNEQIKALRTPVEVIRNEPIAQEPEPAAKTQYIWQVLLVVSALLNVALLLVVWLQKKKKITDDTPLVDYDIGDDAL